jgi:hypothetical protein
VEMLDAHMKTIVISYRGPTECHFIVFISPKGVEILKEYKEKHDLV